MSSTDSSNTFVSYFVRPSVIPPSFFVEENLVSVITKIRQEVLQVSNSFDPLDRKKIEGNDIIVRHLIHTIEKNSSHQESFLIAKTVKGILTTLKWRKEVGINEVRVKEIPREFFRMSPPPYIGKDGRLYVISHLRYYYRNDKFSLIFYKEFLALAEKLYDSFVSQSPRGAIDLRPINITDVRGLELSQVDPFLPWRSPKLTYLKHSANG